MRTDASGAFHIAYRDLLPTPGRPVPRGVVGSRTTTAVVAVDRARPVTVVDDLRLFTATPPPDGVEVFSPWGARATASPIVDAGAPWSATIPLRIDLTGEPDTDPVYVMLAGVHAPGFELISMLFFVTYYDVAGHREGISTSSSAASTAAPRAAVAVR